MTNSNVRTPEEDISPNSRTVDSDSCPECGGSVVVDTAASAHVCNNCGLITEQAPIDRGPEWRSYESDTNSKSRVGAPLTATRHDRGLSTVISRGQRDANGRGLSPQRREQMKRLRTWDKRVKAGSGRERSLRRGLSEIQRMCAALGTSSNVTETAAVLYRRVVTEGVLPGRSVEGAATACVYAASRQCDTPRTPTEMARVAQVDRTRFERTYRYILREFNLAIAPSTPKQYLPRFISRLDDTAHDGAGLHDKHLLERTTVDVLDAISETTALSGTPPTSVAAAALYVAGRICNNPLTQAEISAATNVSRPTIRKWAHEVDEVVSDHSETDN